MLTCVGVLVAAVLWQAPGEESTPAGIQRNSSYYIDMPDGARIAADLWLPANLEIDQRIPAVVEGTRYWRNMGLTFPGRVAAMFGVELPGVEPDGYNAFFPAHGYAMLTIDVRGTGASSGVHTTEYSLEETADYRHILQWITEQPWSSGDTFAIGVSYSGTSAELMTTSRHSSLRAVAPLYSDFDAQMQLATPGGVYQPAFIEAWSKLVEAMDRNDLCGVINATVEEEQGCSGPEFLISGVKPVEGAESSLVDAVAEHASPNVAAMVRSLRFRDSPWGTTETRPSENLPFGLKSRIETANVPMFVVTGWFDAATTNGALARFATFRHPQEVWIGAFSHGGEYDTDPYRAPDAPSRWTQQEQMQRVLGFFERHRTDKPAQPIDASRLHYYVNGTEAFRQTDRWPPAHLRPMTYYFTSGGALELTQPAERGFERYRVDPGTATAKTSRWQTQLGGSDVVYNRRAEMAERSLTYTSPPFEVATELTGSIVLDLWMTSNRDAGVIHAYLEDVAPDGEVRYLTEGVLNLLHRATSDAPAYPMFGPTHSFLEEDASPVPIGQMFSFSTTLFATSALIQPGHRVRLSLTGADGASFARLPEDDPPPQWTLYHGPTSPSSITLHTAPWDLTE